MTALGLWPSLVRFATLVVGSGGWLLAAVQTSEEREGVGEGRMGVGVVGVEGKAACGW